MCTLFCQKEIPRTTQALLIAINVCAVGSDRPVLTRLVQLTRVADVSRPSRGASVRRAKAEQPKQRQTTKVLGGRAISRADLTAVCCVCIKPI